MVTRNIRYYGDRLGTDFLNSLDLINLRDFQKGEGIDERNDQNSVGQDWTSDLTVSH